MRPESLIGKALVVRVIAVTIDHLRSTERHQPAVLVGCLVLNRMTGEDTQHTGDATEYAPAFRHHGFDAGFIQTLGVKGDDVLHRLPGTAD